MAWTLGLPPAARAAETAPKKNPGALQFSTQQALVTGYHPAGPPLSLSAFLEQTASTNDAIRSARLSAAGALGRVEDGALVTAPSLFANIQAGSDAKSNVFFAFPYNKIITDTYALGVAQTTSFGLQSRLYYGVSYFNYDGFPSTFNGGQSSFFEARPTLELTASLWRNFLGEETRGTKTAIEAGARAGHFGQSYAARGALADAEISYWNLSLARENVEIQRAGLERSRRIFEWTERRARLQLADQADSLQAQAALDVRRLALQQAQDDARSASVAFNRARGLASDEVSESLMLPSIETVVAFSSPARSAMREDVLAAEEQAKANEASARVSRERDKPTLEAFGSLSLNGHDKEMGSAIGNSFHSSQPTAAVGLRLNAPLDFGSARRAREGWQAEQESAELAYRRKIFEQEQDWSDLTHRLTESKRRLGIAREIEKSQQLKLEHERDRLNKGRTTTYQVLLFEQDFSQAELARIQTEAEILTLIARMKLFGGPS